MLVLTLTPSRWSRCEAHAKSEAERIKREPKSRRLPPEANIKISAMTTYAPDDIRYAHMETTLAPKLLVILDGLQ